MDQLECVQIVNVYFEPTDVQPIEPQYIELLIGDDMRKHYMDCGKQVRKAVSVADPLRGNLPDEAFYLYALGVAMLDQLPSLVRIEHRYRVSSVVVKQGIDEGCRLSLPVDGKFDYFAKQQLH